eukprot:1152300-Pelagomonas_calceolata.AAC.6
MKHASHSASHSYEKDIPISALQTFQGCFAAIPLPPCRHSPIRLAGPFIKRVANEHGHNSYHINQTLDI